MTLLLIAAALVCWALMSVALGLLVGPALRSMSRGSVAEARSAGRPQMVPAPASVASRVMHQAR